MTDILSIVEGFLAKSDVTATAFGRSVMGDPNFVFDLRDGRDIRGSTAQRIREYVEANTPNANEAAQ